MTFRRGLLVALVAVAMACGGGATQDGGAAPTGVAPEVAVADARTVVTARKSEDIGICDFESGWGYAALRALDAAKDPAASARLAASDPALDALTSEDLFRRWHDSRTASIGTDTEVMDYLGTHGDWYEASGTTVPEVLHLQSDGTFAIRRIGAPDPAVSEGRWSVMGGHVVFAVSGSDTPATLTQGPWALMMDAGGLGTFEVGPLVGDC